MNERELVNEEKMLARLFSSAQNFGRPPNRRWAKQLEEARAGWRRRHPIENPKNQ
jgi:hypothetical protein